MNAFSVMLESAREGDAEAVARLYEQYGSAVAASIRKRLRQPLRRRFDTMDIGHSVFVEVIRELPRYWGEASLHRRVLGL